MMSLQILSKRNKHEIVPDLNPIHLLLCFHRRVQHAARLLVFGSSSNLPASVHYRSFHCGLRVVGT